VVFCDGDFWHGKNYKKEHSNYEPFWVEKIKRNIDRDKLVNKTLRKDGWRVLRFWKSDILKNLKGCIDKIESELQK
jgi:DNA mismatch endonuclease Vsr